VYRLTVNDSVFFALSDTKFLASDTHPQTVIFQVGSEKGLVVNIGTGGIPRKPVQTLQATFPDIPGVYCRLILEPEFIRSSPGESWNTVELSCALCGEFFIDGRQQIQRVGFYVACRKNYDLVGCNMRKIVGIRDPLQLSER
jgi:hypothetical protein